MTVNVSALVNELGGETNCCTIYIFVIWLEYFFNENSSVLYTNNPTLQNHSWNLWWHSASISVPISTSESIMCVRNCRLFESLVFETTWTGSILWLSS